MKLKLRAIKDGADKNTFCGPSVVSALAGITTGEAARLIRKNTGRRRITGTHWSEILDALRSCNIKATPYSACDDDGHRVSLSRRAGPTLARWLRLSKKDRTSDRVFLVSAGYHWQLISGRRYTCGRIREIVSIKDKRVKRRARVVGVWELTSDNVRKPEVDISKPKDPYASSRAEAHRFAKRLGCSIEVERLDGYRTIWIDGPDSLPPQEDFEGSYASYDWDEALWRLREYEYLLKEREKAAGETATSS